MNAEKIQNQTQQGFEQIQDQVSHMLERAKPVVEEMVSKSKKAYQDTLKQLPQDSEKYILFAGLGVTAGLIGYALGKKAVRNESVTDKIKDVSSDIKKEATEAVDFVTPALKFVKLWMFFRLS